MKTETTEKPRGSDRLEPLVRHQHEPDCRLLCHICAEHNRWAFYQLLYRVRGEHVCEKCGRKFTVTFKPNAGGQHER